MTESIPCMHDRAAEYALQADHWIRMAWRMNDAFIMQLGLRKLRIAWRYSDEASALETKHGSVFPGARP